MTMTKENKDKVIWAVTNDLFDGLTVSELLMEPEKHPAAFGALLYCLNGAKVRGGEIRTNTQLADVREALSGWNREKVDAKAKVDRMVQRIME